MNTLIAVAIAPCGVGDELSAEVAAYKKAQGMAVLDRTRELEILQNREAQAGEFGAQVREIYEKIFEMSRAYQQQLLK